MFFSQKGNIGLFLDPFCCNYNHSSFFLNNKHNAFLVKNFAKDFEKILLPSLVL